MKTNRKIRPQPSLASLSTDEYHQLADMVRTRTYDDILQQIVKPRAEGGFDLDISIKPLQVLHRRVTELDRVNQLIADGQKLTLTAYDELQAGQTPPTEQIHNAILNATWLQVQYCENTPNQLLALQRLADFPARAEIRENREQIYQEKHTHRINMDTFHKEHATERLEIQKRHLQIAEKRAEKELSTQNSTLARNADHLGPFARNWDDISERARIHFGVSKEEWARRTGANEEQTTAVPENLSTSVSAADEQLSALAHSQHSTEYAPSDSALNPAASVDVDDDDFDYENMPSISPNPLPPEIIAHNLAFSKKLREGKIIIDRSGPYVRAVELPDTDAPSSSNGGTRSPSPTSTSRDALDYADVPPSDQNAPIENSEMNSTSSTSAFSAPSASIPTVVPPMDPAELAARVDRYTTARAREYLDYHQKRSEWTSNDPNPLPQYITQYRHCPCGQGSETCPCPIHEDENEFGRYFSYFWTLSPFGAPYAETLRERNLPYRRPEELIP